MTKTMGNTFVLRDAEDVHPGRPNLITVALSTPREDVLEVAILASADPPVVTSGVPHRAADGPRFPSRAALVALAVVLLAAACSSTGAAPAVRDTRVARLAGVSVYPLPGTSTASPGSEISFRGVDPGLVTAVTVTGSISGDHPGAVVPHSDARGASFVPATPFVPGETVTVDPGGLDLADGTERVTFDIGRPVSEKIPPPTKRPDAPEEVATFVSRPDLRPPVLEVKRSAPYAAPGLLFLAPKHGASQEGVMIADRMGSTVWFHPSAPGKEAQDFRVQTYRHAPVLTWWEGDGITGHGRGRYLIYDTSYREVASFGAGNGLPGDFHEFRLTDRDTALVTSYNPVLVDTARFGGASGTRAVFDSVAQEIDVASGRVLFEWHSLGAVGLDESYVDPDDPKRKGPYDYFHINSVDEDGDGNLVVSARNTHAVYKIDRQTGRVLWRLGGKLSDFDMADGTETAFQHDARMHPDGTLTVFDNGGGSPRVHDESRALVIRLDQDEMTATLVRAYTQPGALAANSQGNMQRLPGGDVFVGWGQQPYMSEFTSGGRLLFSARLPGGTQTYRAYLANWQPRPADLPAVVIRATDGGGATIYASWNGATDVARWRLLAGPDADHLAPDGLDHPALGFETAIAYDGTPAWLAVAAVAADGRQLALSPALRWEGARTEP